MNFFENSLVDLINLEEQLSSDWVDVANGDLPQQAVTNHIHELRDIIEELRKHHESLVVMNHCLQKLQEVQL